MAQTSCLTDEQDVDVRAADPAGGYAAAVRPTPRDLVRAVASSLAALTAACAPAPPSADAPTRRNASTSMPPLPPPSAAIAASAPAGEACCRGLNTCKGRGGCAVDGEHECQGKNECRARGGCNRMCP